jgi:opacity protein-like surface antigen
LHTSAVFLGALLLSIAPVALAQGSMADAYFGYSRVGANLYAPNTPGMNGWQASLHVRTISIVGVEGDVSHYSQSPLGFSEQVTLAMAGPRVTLGVKAFKGFSVFAHGLAGLAHENATVTIYPSTSYSAVSYALGAGADLPLVRGLKLRVTGDYLGNSNAPSPAGSASPAHFRFGVGGAYHF